MKWKLLLLIKMLSKYTFYALIIQSLTLSIISAAPGNAQVTSVKDAYIHITKRNVSLQQVFNTVEAMTNYEFTYDARKVNLQQSIADLNYEGNVYGLLVELSERCDCRFKQVNENITVSKAPAKRKVAEERVSVLQEVVVKGKVSDSSGEILPGVTILVKGTTQGTTTDMEGNYSIAVAEDAVLVFSYIGYKTQEVVVGSRSQIDVLMDFDQEQLDEVVVVGYGTQQKENLTGAVSSVNFETIQNRPIASASTALSGLAPGVHVNQSSGQPGRDNATIRIRGIGTLGNSNPLVLVDGIEASMNDINPNDIESMTVLKDAASAAIYGSRAANGVIIITTKKGKEGKLKLSYNGYYAWQKATNIIESVNDYATYMELANEGLTNVGGQPKYSQETIDAWKSGKDPLVYPNTDWTSLIFQAAPMQEHHISLNGGTEKMRFLFSTGVLDQEGIIPNTSYKRYNMRLNWDADVTKKLKIGANISGSWNIRKEPGDVATIMNWLGGTAPGIVPESPDGFFGGAQALDENQQLNNPWSVIQQRDKQEEWQRFLARGFLEYEIVDGLTFQTNAAIKYYNMVLSDFNPKGDLYKFLPDGEKQVHRPYATRASLTNKNRRDYNITLFTTLTYEKQIGRDHFIKVLAGFNQEEYRKDEYSASIKEFPNNNVRELNAGLEDPTLAGTAEDWALRSYFGRVNYELRDRYLFEANIRYDGSSRFAQGNQWGAFPSLSLGWRISEEAFLQDVDFIDNLKLRASWGKLGNQNINRLYGFASSYTTGLNYSFNGNLVSGIAPTALANRDITWETSTTTDIGLDIELLEGKFSLTADYFDRTTEGILVAVPIPKTMGNLTSPVQNIAKVQNKGWELTLGHQNTINELNYSASFNVTKVDNEVIKYKGGNAPPNGVFLIREGHAINSLYGYKVEGIFQSDDEVTQHATQWPGTSAGDLKYADLNDDGKIDGDDRTVIGNIIPEYYFGLNLSASYKGFDLSALFQGVANQDVFLTGNFIAPFASSEAGMFPTRWLDRWTPDNKSTELPRLTHSSRFTGNIQNSSFWIEDASFIRLKNLQIGYTLPAKVTDKLGVEKVRVYANGQNLLTWTSFEGFDPERDPKKTQIVHPNVRIMSLGLNVNF
ncbi:TonB-dependent receptor [Rapidithrix thailandica]|uniref:TonB-dependent receptor n=1 Tax=Rapidithrix thailandica TaxID=413964 RepID=A0AAW9SIP4_9BACT